MTEFLPLAQGYALYIDRDTLRARGVPHWWALDSSGARSLAQALFGERGVPVRTPRDMDIFVSPDGMLAFLRPREKKTWYFALDSFAHTLEIAHALGHLPGDTALLTHERQYWLRVRGGEETAPLTWRLLEYASPVDGVASWFVAEYAREVVTSDALRRLSTL